MDSEKRPDVPLGRRSPMAKTRVVVADRNVITRVGIRAILERNAGTAVVAEATTYETVLDAVDEHGPDVLVIDLDLGDDTTAGLKLCQEITERYEATRIFSACIFTLRDGGARGIASWRCRLPRER